MPLRIIFTFLPFCFFYTTVFSQITVKGTVLDKGKLNYVESVMVMSTGGKIAITDSLGHYVIKTKSGDSLYFVYNNKPTQKFPVNTIANTEQFDISIHLNIKSNFTILKKVVVFSKSYKRDSLENRENYGEVFSYHKPRIETSITPGGGVGMDANELINMFRFKRNKRLQKFQERLEADEQEKYVNYRFNKTFVRRITQLKGASLDSFLIWYRPSYLFASTSNDVVFNQYVLNAFYHYQKIKPDTYPLPTSENVYRNVEAKKEE
jgi:hypothetical protein